MVDKVQKRLPSKPVEKDYLLDFVNKELTPQMERLRLLTSALLDLFMSGEGSPEGLITARPPAIYQQTDGAPGSQIWVKRTGVEATGWVAVL